MKLGTFHFCLLVIMSSCKINERNIVGSYHQRFGTSGILTVKSNHTFSYNYLNVNYVIKNLPADSAQIGTVGTWHISAKKVILNSFGKHSIDTNRFIVSRKKNNTGISSFVFKSFNGDSIGIRGVRSNKNNLRYVFHTEGYANYEAYTHEIDTLYFQFDFNKAWRFVKKDTVSADYIITIQPHFTPDMFQNLSLIITHKQLKDENTKWVFEKEKHLIKPHHVFFNGTQSGTSYRN